MFTRAFVKLRSGFQGICICICVDETDASVIATPTTRQQLHHVGGGEGAVQQSEIFGTFDFVRAKKYAPKR